MQKKEPTALDAMESECQALTQRLAEYGLGFQLPGGMLLETALTRLLIEKGIIAHNDEWRLMIATVTRDALAEAVARAPEIQKKVRDEQVKQKLLVPDHVRARMNPKLN